MKHIHIGKRTLAILMTLCLLFGTLPGIALADGTQNYYGYQSGSAYTTGTYVEAVGRYMTSNVSRLYVKPEGAPDSQAEVAYCFNQSQGWPVGTFYTKSANVSADVFGNVATKKRGTSAELYQHVMSIGLNGYPLDYSGFNRDPATGKQLINDDAFRALTQKAIWHYTDSDTWPGNETYRMSSTETAIYDKLIGQVLTTDEINQLGAALDLYLWNSTKSPFVADGSSHTGYQNLLAINLSKVTILDLTKNAVNGDAEDIFTFDLTVNTGDGKKFWINDTTTAAGVTQNGNTLTVTMKAGETLSLSSLASSFSYSIEEKTDPAPASGKTYTPSITVTSGVGTVDPDNSYKVTGTDVTVKNTHVVYTNTAPADTPDTPAPDPTPDPTPTPTPDIPKETDVDDDLGYVAIKKEVSVGEHHTATGVYDGTYTFEVALTAGDDSAAYTGKEGTDGKSYVDCATVKEGTTVNGELEVVDGKVTFQLAADEEMKLTLPAGTNYSIEEINVPANFTSSFDAAGSTGTVTKNVTNTHTVINTYDESQEVMSSLVIEKKVTGTAADPDAAFKFLVDVGDPKYNGVAYYTGTTDEAGTLTDGKGTITLKAGQSATITDLHGDLNHKIKVEESHIPAGYEYAAMNVTEGTTEITESAADVKVGLAEIAGWLPTDGGKTYTVTYTNAVTTTAPTNELVIRKVLDGGTEADADVEFKIQIEVDGYTGDVYYTGEDTVAGTLDQDGKGTITLKAGQSVTISGLGAGARFGTEETDIPAGYAFKNVTATLKGATADDLVTLHDKSDATLLASAFAEDGEHGCITVTYTNGISIPTVTSDDPKPAPTPDTTPEPDPTPTPTPDTIYYSDDDDDDYTPDPTPTPGPEPTSETSSLYSDVTSPLNGTDGPLEQAEEAEQADLSAPISDTDAGTQATLPQTGMNWMPFLTAAALGIILVTAGIVYRKRRREDRS